MTGKKILLVDDSPVILTMERMILSKGPYELVVARNGREALEKVRAEHPDLILMDQRMPVLDGMAAVRELRADPAHAELPVIMLTGSSEARDVEEAFASGCSDYLVKPIDAAALLAKVRSLLGE